MRPTPSLLARKFKRSQQLPFDMAQLSQTPFDFPLTRPTLLNLDNQRVFHHYLRLEELQFNELVAFRQKFHPPTSAQFITLRRQHYQGEPHPSAARVSISFASSHPALGLSPTQLHKLRLIAGPRWDPETDQVKISCELFDEPSMNERWCSNALDRIVEAAKDESDSFADMPLPEPKTPKKKIVTLKDFPKEWLGVPKSTERS